MCAAWLYYISCVSDEQIAANNSAGLFNSWQPNCKDVTNDSVGGGLTVWRTLKDKLGCSCSFQFGICLSKYICAALLLRLAYLLRELDKVVCVCVCVS